MIRPRNLFLIFVFLFTLKTIPVTAQTTLIHATDLILPNKIITAGEHSLLVAETGTFDPNTGRISLVDRITGDRKTLIDGLPSGVNNLGGVPTPNGPSGLVLHGRILYICISSGDAVQSPAPGLESPNPNPSSPLFDSVLELTLPGGYEEILSEFHLTFQHQQILVAGNAVTLMNSEDEKMIVRMVANLPDFISEPRPPEAPNNVRASNLYGLELFKTNLYVVDASLNLLYKVDISNGSFTVFAVFPPLEIPEGPVFETVPDNIHRVGNRLLIPFLTGYPFPSGGAEIRRVSIANGSQLTFIDGLTSAIDVLHVDATDSYYTLEFSTDFLANAPGRLRFYSSPDAAPVDVAAGFITPTSMTRDEATGDLFITNIFPGLVTRVTDLP